MTRSIFAVVLTLLFVAGSALALADKATSDDAIYDNVRRKLASDPIVKGGALEVEVKGGVVTIRGAVETDKQRQRATKVAHKVRGVKSVVNELKLKGK